jgi:hypothetical protein
MTSSQRVLTGLLADSCQPLLWAAAYLINGRCSDDGDDEAEMARRLPRLTALCWPST